MFSVPTIIPISSHARLIKDDSDSISLEEILNKYLRVSLRPDPVQLFLDSLLLYGRSDNGFKRGVQLLNVCVSSYHRQSSDFMNVRLELMLKVIKDVVPSDILSKFVSDLFSSSTDHWIFRRAFSQQFALSTFMCYVLAFGHRTPSKYNLSLNSGMVLMAEVLPSTASYHHE